jgi:hypothetical protein
MDGWWLMGFAGVVEHAVDGGHLGDERDDTTASGFSYRPVSY